MKKLEEDVYLEEGYPGVLLAALVMPGGTLMIDAPPRPDDGRSWLAALRGVGAGKDRLLVNLDAHPDRALGARSMESNVIAQEQTVEVFNQRSAIFKSQSLESGAAWESVSGLSGIRWLAPNLTFKEQAVLHWGAPEVLLEHHPGPEAGAAWVVVPDKELVFVGDAVVLKQPPFLARADIDQWVETLDELLKKPFKDFTIVSGRGGLVPQAAIRGLRSFLRDVQTRLGRMAARKAVPAETESLVPKLLKKYKFTGKLEETYAQRLRYGLFHYYANHYHPAPMGVEA